MASLACKCPLQRRPVRRCQAFPVHQSRLATGLTLPGTAPGYPLAFWKSQALNSSTGGVQIQKQEAQRVYEYVNVRKKKTRQAVGAFTSFVAQGGCFNLQSADFSTWLFSPGVSFAAPNVMLRMLPPRVNLTSQDILTLDSGNLVGAEGNERARRQSECVTITQ
ncbi:uncharacterized protein [Dermacentor albipictus]|uniref:uncharacterized protein n=1 Tax=Dermacentor albipictus TaxID=60249 RepID=UPI0038FCD7E0